MPNPTSTTAPLRDLKDKTASYANEASERVAETKDDLTDIANNAGRSIRRFFTNGKREASDLADTATSAIRSKPLQSGLIVLAAGFVLGKLLRR